MSKQIVTTLIQQVENSREISVHHSTACFPKLKSEPLKHRFLVERL